MDEKLIQALSLFVRVETKQKRCIQLQRLATVVQALLHGTRVHRPVREVGQAEMFSTDEQATI